MKVGNEAAAWAAGIYEGEGTCDKNGSVCVVQKDLWLLHKLEDLFGGTVAPKMKVYNKWSASGKTARMFIVTIWPWLSPRRKEQAVHIFKKGAQEWAQWNQIEINRKVA